MDQKAPRQSPHSIGVDQWHRLQSVRFWFGCSPSGEPKSNPHRLKSVLLDRAGLTLCLHAKERANGHRQILGGVEVWRRSLGETYRLSGPFVCRCLTSRPLLLFPHPAHRTGRAERPHPALGESLTMSPTENCASAR